MSRSTRKTPAGGITTARSEKKDKQCWHRAFRSASRQNLQAIIRDWRAGDGFLDVSFREKSSRWKMAKDGKTWRGPWWDYPENSPESRALQRRRFLAK
jgi:hypothetical protein